MPFSNFFLSKISLLSSAHMVAMGTASAIKIHTHTQNHMVEGFRSKYMELRWVRRRSIKNPQAQPKLLLKPALFPVYISTDPTHINPHELQALYANCNHSCYRFPNVDSHGRVEPVDIQKLRIALSHSAVLVSVFCKSHHIDDDDNDDGGDDNVDEDSISTSSSSNSILGIAGFVQKVMPVTPFDGQLVGFGRAISDYGLTAAIYDVMVIPSLRRMGIGQMIVKKILRMLTNREIYDISALCAGNQRYFFRSCGFRHDLLGSTTMMYTRTAMSTTQERDDIVTRAGQKLLLIPPLRGPCKSSSE